MTTENYYDIVKNMSTEKLKQAITKLDEGLKTEKKWTEDHKKQVEELIKKLKKLLTNRQNAEILKEITGGKI